MVCSIRRVQHRAIDCEHICLYGFPYLQLGSLLTSSSGSTLSATHACVHRQLQVKMGLPVQQALIGCKCCW